MTTYPEVYGAEWAVAKVVSKAKEIRMQRRMLWQQARGLLLSMLETYGVEEEAEFEKVDEVVREFCEWMRRKRRG